jgi:hypothetical protein
VLVALCQSEPLAFHLLPETAHLRISALLGFATALGGAIKIVAVLFINDTQQD